MEGENDAEITVAFQARDNPMSIKPTSADELLLKLRASLDFDKPACFPLTEQGLSLAITLDEHFNRDRDRARAA